MCSSDLDAKEWAIRMSEKGYAYKTIDNYKRSLKASFYMAIQDDCIRKNPFEFKLSDVLEDDTEQKVILTPEQEERLLAFMEKDKIYSKYYDEVVLLLETGESTPGESEPSVTAEPSAEPTSARLSFQTTGSLTPIPY